MTPDLDKKLRAAYPLVFPEPLLNDEPIRCGDGWYYILDMLCRDLQALIEKAAPEERHRLRAVQVKEKFGVLRFYLDRTPYDPEHPQHEVACVIAGAEWCSGIFCDVCGKPGAMRSGEGVERPMLMRTRCDDHVNWFGPQGFAHAT